MNGKRIWFISTMNRYYSAVKKYEILAFEPPWIDLEGIMLMK